MPPAKQNSPSVWTTIGRPQTKNNAYFIVPITTEYYNIMCINNANSPHNSV